MAVNRSILRIRQARPFTSVCDVVERAVQRASRTIQRRGLTCEIDVPRSLCSPVDKQVLESLVNGMLGEAIEKVDVGGSLYLMAIEGRSGLEIEVAYDGPCTRSDLSGTSRQGDTSRPSSFTPMTGQCQAWQRRPCPDGGVALIACIAHAKARAAA